MDPFLSAAAGDSDGLNRDTTKGQALLVGSYAEDIDVEILLLKPGEFDSAIATLGDVNFNSPAPYGGLKQKYVWAVTTTTEAMNVYGASANRLGAEKGPNSRGPLDQPNGGSQQGKVASVVHLGTLRSDVALVDSDGIDSKFGSTAGKYIMFRGSGNLPANALRDPNRHIKDKNNVALSMFYFVTADKMRWHDRNGDAHWDRGDELWIDNDVDGKYTAGDDIVFDFDSNLALTTAGVLVDNTTEFRYLRGDDTNTVGSYTKSNGADYIYTTHFNSMLYTQARDAVFAHEVLGHPLMLQHHSSDTIMWAPAPGAASGFTANGLYEETRPTRYFDIPTKFNDLQQDQDLQLRE